MKNIFAANAAAMQSACLQTFSGANDPDGEPVSLYWPGDADDEDFSASVPAFSGTTRIHGATLPGLPRLVADGLSFGASLADFPAASPPREGVIFLAGSTLESAVQYRADNVQIVAGIVQIDASRHGDQGGEE